MTTNSGFGVASMVTPLRRVAMRRPGRATLEADPKVWHYAEPLDPQRLAAQYDRFVDLVAGSGAAIEWIDDADDGLADAIFTFDPSFMTGAGAVLLRAGKALREPEIDSHSALYARLGIPVLGTIREPGTVEGGDCLWVDEHTLAVGRGFRSNQPGIHQLREILSDQGVVVEAFDLPVWDGEAACLHLLSMISPLDRDLALVYPRLMPVALLQLLQNRGIQLLEAPEAEFEASRGLSLNVLATAPRSLIAIDGCPETARLMRDAGCEVSVFEADALCIPCEGGPTCLTRPLLRD